MPFSLNMPDSTLRSVVSEAAAAWTATLGVAGFFKPRFPPAVFYPPGAPEALSYYDTAPLRATLEKLVDFDRINSGEMRLSLGAVNVRTGQLVYFDNTDKSYGPIGPEHVMASGALPPGFPPIEIGGEHYWDGGVVSNTPLQYILQNEPKDDLLIFQVDLFNAHGAMPRTLLEATEREKDIRYASRTDHNTDVDMKIHAAKVALRALLSALPEELRNSPNAALLGDLSYENAVTVVKLCYRRKPYEGPSKDYEFSRRTMLDHWKTGLADLRHAMHEKRGEMLCERHKTAAKTIETDSAP
jgi:NTE family protein